MSDLGDPTGASRADRRHAIRLIDAAYAAGRLSAADRGLRITQVEVASTRGDLAMVTRDLAEPPSSAPQPAEPPDTEGARPWPPPGTSVDGPRGTDRRVVGCVVAAVVAFMLLPCLLGIGIFVVTTLAGSLPPSP